MASWVYGAAAAAVVLVALGVTFIVLRRRHHRAREFARELLEAHTTAASATAARSAAEANVEALIGHVVGLHRQAAESTPPLAMATLDQLAELSDIPVVAGAETVVAEAVVVEQPVPVITVVPAVVERVTSREVELLDAVLASRPQWLPAAPLRETLIKTAALTHGVRRALSAESRDRVLVEIQLEMRRSRRERNAAVKAFKRSLRGVR